MAQVNVKDFVDAITQNGKIDPNFFETVRYIKGMDWVPVITERIYEALCKSFPGNEVKIECRSRQMIQICFRTKSEIDFEIVLFERNWAQNYTIELLDTRDKDGKEIEINENKDIMPLLKPVFEKHQHAYERRDARIYYGGHGGLQYIGNEQKYYETVRAIIKALL